MLLLPVRYSAIALGESRLSCSVSLRILLFFRQFGPKLVRIVPVLKSIGSSEIVLGESRLFASFTQNKSQFCNSTVEFKRAHVASLWWVCGNILWQVRVTKAFYRAAVELCQAAQLYVFILGM